MNLDTYVMIARSEQEQRIAQAAKFHLLAEAEKGRRSSRTNLFSRRAGKTR